MSRSIGRNFIAVFTALLLVGAGLGVAGCGGSGSDQEAINQAKDEGAKEAREEIRIKEIQKELKALRRRGGRGAGSAPAPTDSSSAPAPSSPTSSSSNCGSEVSVNSVTSCPFGENVMSAYFEEVGTGSGSVYAYSPTTSRSYSMYCTAGSPHECTGGNGAAVYFP